MTAITQEIKFAPDLAPNYTFFLRSANLASLQGIVRILEIDPWADFTLTDDFFFE